MAKFIILCLGLLASAANVNILRSYEGFQVPDGSETVISLGSKVESEWGTVSFSFFIYPGDGVTNREKILKVRDRDGNELGAIYRSAEKVDIEWTTDSNAKDECDSDASVLTISIEINRSEWSFIGFTVNPGDKLVQGFYINKASTYPFLSKTTLKIAPLIFPTISPDHTLAFGPISAKDTILTSFNLHDFAFCVDNFMGLLYFEHLGVLKMTKDYSFSIIEKYFLDTPLTTLQPDLGELIIEPSETVYNLYQPDLPLDQGNL
jgi:hypothetical protein